jgi:hypothetical protein
VSLTGTTTYVYRIRSQNAGSLSSYSTLLTVVTLATSVCD